jgi:hypothetical protein
MKDLFFHYKYICRFLLIQKLGCLKLNTYSVPYMAKSVVFFSVRNLVDLEDLRGSNYFFLIKLYFGRRSFFVNYESCFSLNVLYHSFVAELILTGRNAYFPMIFLLNDLQFFLAKKDFSIVVSNSVLNFEVFDMNIFSERKTNVGFFNLKDNLNLSFYCSGSIRESKILFKILKLV